VVVGGGPSSTRGDGDVMSGIDDAAVDEAVAALTASNVGAELAGNWPSVGEPATRADADILRAMSCVYPT
jgi:hypothetical protein